MGKAGRFACIFIPMGLTIASLVCLIFVFLGSREAKNGTTNQFYFFRADASNFTQNPQIDALKGTTIDNDLLSQLIGAATANNLSDIYQVGLWDYCDGSKNNSTGSVNLTFCSKPESSYWFNPVEVWGLSNTTAQEHFGKELNDGLKAYQKVAHWMFIAYVVAIACTAAEIIVGFFAIFSRWGSCVTTIISSASTLFTIAGAITSTALSVTLVGALNTTLKPYGIHSSLGTKMLSVVWLAVAFSLVSGLFWTFSTCCCSGKSGYKRDGGIRRQGTLVERTPYTHEYKPLADPAYGPPAFGQQGVPMKNMSGAASGPHYQQPQHGGFEPYRTV